MTPTPPSWPGRLSRSDGLPTPIEREAGLRGVLSSVLGVERPRPSVGPYELSQKLGSGGMGVVYAALDPRLQRRVALKLLRPDLARDQRDEILREARALARLSHPHVVGVFATGVAARQAWIAMELVQGSTLSQWSTAHPPTSPDRQARALAMLLDIASGLQAAHAAGLVHRDVKPGNVLVGDDGRARLADFGLARDAIAASGTPADTRSGRGSSPSDRIPPTPADTRAFAGTPRYMAPELLAGGPATTQSDQYAFCLMAWEVLVGRFPFEDVSATALALAKANGEAPRTDPSFVPRVVLRALRRGLHPDPARRLPSMDALLRAVSDPRARARWAAWACAGVLVVCAAALGSRGSAMAATRPGCDDASTTARLDAVWDGARRDALRRAVSATPVPYTSHTLQTVERGMDAFAGRWAEVSRTTCQQAWHDVTLEAARLDATMACLHRQLDVADRFVERVVRGDAATIEHAAVGADRLPDPASCQAGEGPAGSEAPVRSEASRRALAAAEAALLLGDAPGAIEIARGVTETARVEADETALGEGLALLGDASISTGALESALADLGVAYELATAADEPRRQGERARLAAVAASGLHRWDEARKWLRHAETAADRMHASPLQRARIEAARCRVEWEASAHDHALAACDLALQATVGDTSPAATELARQIRTTSVAVLKSLGRADEAEAISRALLDEQRAALGDDHPAIGGAEQNLGALAYAAGRVDAAIEHFQRAESIFARSWGPDSRWAISATMSRGAALRQKGDLEGAAAAIEDALARARTRGDAQAAHVATNLAAVREAEGRIDEALALVQEARAIEDEHLAADDPARSLTSTMAARLHERRGDLKAALLAQEEALALRLAAGDRRQAAISMLALGELLEQQHRPDEALARVLEARRIHEHDGVEGIDRAAVAAAAGDLLARAGRVDEALPLLDEALRFWETSDRRDAPDRIARIREAQARADAGARK